MGGLQQVDHAAQPRTKHEGEPWHRELRLAVQPRSDDLGGLVDAVLELRAVEPVGQRAPADRLHLEALQQLALLRLVLLGGDEALVAQPAQALQPGRDVA